MFLSVSLSVEDSRSCLRGEHHQSVLIFTRELVTTIFLRKIDVANLDSTMADRHSEEGLHWRVVLGKSHGIGMAGNVRESQRFLNLVHVSEQSQALR